MGLPELVFTRGAHEDIQKLPEPLRVAVANTLETLAVELRRVGVPLLGRLRGRWSSRVGNYRIVYTIEVSSAHERVVVRAVRHRSIAYGRRRRRP
ncbi:MAG: type II toxin-antitoxin system RelE/ParE family toxin [Chloroflexi bacterium]|nr:MAG: type II toxin-antitoxin system RelE/ParE family toxin [Chloroflexota bacterium]